MPTGLGIVPVTLTADLPSGRSTWMVWVPEGRFWMGSEDGEDEERPARRVFLDAYAIDKYEVTVSDYQACVEAGACPEPATGEDCNWNRGGRDDHPVNCVSWFDADRYCLWAGKRLPTEAEWEKAARGTDRRTFPWGEAEADCDRAVIGYGSLGCGRQGTWPVGSKPAGMSPYGALDMIGNVWEWTADGYGLDAYATVSGNNPVYTAPGGYKVLRGNSWYYSYPLMVSRASNRYRFRPLRWYPYIGMRCVQPRGEALDLPHDPMAEKVEAAARPYLDWMEKNRAARTTEGETAFAPGPRQMEGVRVPGGYFTMGSNRGEEDEIPVRRIYLKAYTIDRYEVTVAQYRTCVEAGVCREPYSGSGAYLHTIEGTYCNWGRQPERDGHPVNCVSWYDADRYCLWAGKRLPTEAEWEKAARGTDGRRYPWGDGQPDCDRIVMDDGGDGCGRESTWPVGSKPAGASPYGAMDMAGNVWEWTADWYAYDFYSRSQVQTGAVNPFNGVEEATPREAGWATGKVLRGGSWADQTTLIHRSANRLGYGPDSGTDYTIGFRCARDGEGG